MIYNQKLQKYFCKMGISLFFRSVLQNLLCLSAKTLANYHTLKGLVINYEQSF